MLLKADTVNINAVCCVRSFRQPQRARQDSRHQGQQEDQEQQHNRCFRMNVLSERAKAFSLDVIRKILLGR